MNPQTQTAPVPVVLTEPRQNHVAESGAEEFKRLLEKEEFFAFSSISAFQDAQRMAKALCSSSIVPETYRGTDNLGNCIIAVEMANRIGASVLAVMQNLYIVYGRPAWSSQFLISCVNASKRFTPLRYRMTGKREDDTWGCIAWAEDKKGERLESPEITISIAKAEGWYQKNGSKWKTMPELMLRYRCATLFARLYAPELTMGIQTADEVEDIAPVVSEPVRPIFGAPKEERKYDPEMDRVQAPAQAAEPAKPEVKPDPQSDTARMVKAVKQLLKMRNVSEIDLMALLHTEGLDDSIGTVDELAKVAVKTLEKVHEKWADYESKIKGAAK